MSSGPHGPIFILVIDSGVGLQDSPPSTQSSDSSKNSTAERGIPAPTAESAGLWPLNYADGS